VIRCLEALRFRCLRNLRRQIRPFQILVGPNASGKSTFLDAIRFLGQLVSDGLELAVRERSENLQDLFWNRAGQSFELAIDLEIPEARRRLLPEGGIPAGAAMRFRSASTRKPRKNSILAERVLLRHADDVAPVQRQLFPALEESAGYHTDPVPREACEDRGQ
jgi:predicted ATPase